MTRLPAVFCALTSSTMIAPDAGVRISIQHQRRHRKGEPWHDVDHFSLAQLKAGQEVRIQLGAAETLHLYQELQRLYAVASEGIPRGERRLVVADESEAVVIRGPARGVVQALLNRHGPDVWQVLADLEPDLFAAAALKKLHEVRADAVGEFEQHLHDDDWTEDDWQDFFERNTWIFGYGLSYRFLSTLEAQPSYGGTLVTGSGGQRGDFLTAADAEVRFTVLVEIKTPSATLVSDRLYRNKVHLIGAELAGGITQLQSNCRTWELRGSQEEENRERLEGTHTYTIQPKGILVIGRSSELNSSTKRSTFELLRRNTVNPEIITFDELLERARHLLLKEAPSAPGV